MIRARGAAMIESVVVLGVVLTVLFGTFEIGLIGLTQLSSDGAAFLAAHASVVGDSPTGVIASPFPMINNPQSPSVVTISTSAPDSVNEPVDYQIANQSNRHGGAQVVRPSHMQASVTQANVGIGLIMPLVSGGSGFIEGYETVSDDGFDLAGTSLNSAAGQAGEVNYFKDDGNAPPYFIGFRFLWHCNGWAQAASCAGNSSLDGVGLAEILDGSNWNDPVNGTNSPNAVFYAMLLHEQVYAEIAANIATLSPASWATYMVKPCPANANANANCGVGNGSGNANNEYLSSDAMQMLDPSSAAGVNVATGNKVSGALCYLTNVYLWDSAVPPGYSIGSGGFGAHPLNIEATNGCVLP